MKTLELKGTARTEFGKKGSGAVRRAEAVPAVLYGNGQTVHFSVLAADLRHLIYTPHAHIVEIELGGKKELGVMREVQFHPVREEVLHVDFYRIDPAKPVAIDIPVSLVGSSEGVKLGGKLILSKRKLRAQALLKDMPDTIEIDVTDVGLGKSVFVEDVKIPGLTILTPGTTAICAVRMTRAARGAAAAAAADKK